MTGDVCAAARAIGPAFDYGPRSIGDGAEEDPIDRRCALRRGHAGADLVAPDARGTDAQLAGHVAAHVRQASGERKQIREHEYIGEREQAGEHEYIGDLEQRAEHESTGEHDQAGRDYLRGESIRLDESGGHGRKHTRRVPRAATAAGTDTGYRRFSARVIEPTTEVVAPE